MPDSTLLADETARPARSAIDHLIAQGRLGPEAIERARRVAEESGEPVELVLVKLGLVAEPALVDAFSHALGIPAITADDLPVDAVLAGISPQFLKSFHVLPLAADECGLALAMANPGDDYAAEAMALFADQPVTRVVASPGDIDAALERLYPETDGDTPPADWEGADAERLRDLASDAPVVRLVNQIIARAVEARASDLHFEPTSDRLRVRFRIDGRMCDIEAPPLRMRDAVLSRLKIMARLNIAERRLPQDGRMSFAVRGTEIDFRVATVPTIHGESVVVRVLDQRAVSLDFEALGFDEEALASLREIMALPHGIVLVTGPTGSGKTTTLYAALSALNAPHRKIMTIEDPVEYQLDGVNQVQVQPQIGLTFARALRSFLRQNPNIVMVGEIRDLETAQIAVQAALTGHMILSTLHTNDAASGVTRLLDMGVEDYLLTSTVNAIIAQRLVRKLCPQCRAPEEFPRDLAAKLGLADLGVHRLWTPAGCPSCNGTGFHGRTTILEILRLDDGLRRLVLDHAPAGDVARAASAGGMRTMQAHGVRKAMEGITTLDEVFAATRDG